MSSPNDSPVLASTLNPLKYLLTSISSLFQSQRRAWRYFGEHSIDAALASLISGPMEDAGKLLTMTQHLLRKLIDLTEIKLKQLEMEARTAGRDWLGNPKDTEKPLKFKTATRDHRDYGKLSTEAWDYGLNMLPALQARFDVMQNTIEELMPSLMPFIRAAAEINDMVWAFESKLVGILKTVDKGLAFATVAVTLCKYPEADELARERYRTTWSSEHEQDSGA